MLKHFDRKLSMMKYGKSLLENCAATLGLALLVGCGGERLYPVAGIVTLEHGKPMPSGMVAFEMQVVEKFVLARQPIIDVGLDMI